MKDTFFYALRAILPILLMIAAGYAVKCIGPWNQKFFKSLNKLCFHLFLPMNLFCNIYEIEDLSQTNWKLAGVLFLGTIVCMFVGILAVHLFALKREQKGVVIQAAFRSNQAVLGLPLAGALGGQEAMAFASIACAVCVPLFSILAVVVLTICSGDGKKSLSPVAMVKKILQNPLIIASGTAIVLVALREAGAAPAYFLKDTMPSLYKVLTDFGKVASPVMLFVLGTGLDFKATRHLVPQLSLGIALRLIVSPVLVIGTALLLRNQLGLTAVEMPTFVAMCASPVAVSSAVMVQEIGGDDQLASQLVIWSSVLSMGTIFLLVFLLRSIGVL